MVAAVSWRATLWQWCVLEMAFMAPTCFLLDLAVQGLEAPPAGSSSPGLPRGGYNCGGRGRGLVLTCVANSVQTLSVLASSRRRAAHGGGGGSAWRWWRQLRGVCRAHGGGVNPARIWRGGGGAIPHGSSPTATSMASCELA